MKCPWGKKAFEGYLGPDVSTWKIYDACELLESGLQHPYPILMDQGLADDFYPDQLLTKNFERICEKTNQKVQTRYHDGFDHSYYFISTFIDKHLEHHGNAV